MVSWFDLGHLIDTGMEVMLSTQLRVYTTKEKPSGVQITMIRKEENPI